MAKSLTFYGISSDTQAKIYDRKKNDYRDSDLDWIMTLRSSDLQSDSDLDSIHNSCSVFISVTESISSSIDSPSSPESEAWFQHWENLKIIVKNPIIDEIIQNLDIVSAELNLSVNLEKWQMTFICLEFLVEFWNVNDDTYQAAGKLVKSERKIVSTHYC